MCCDCAATTIWRENMHTKGWWMDWYDMTDMIIGIYYDLCIVYIIYCTIYLRTSKRDEHPTLILLRIMKSTSYLNQDFMRWDIYFHWMAGHPCAYQGGCGGPCNMEVDAFRVVASVWVLLRNFRECVFFLEKKRDEQIHFSLIFWGQNFFLFPNIYKHQLLTSRGWRQT